MSSLDKTDGWDPEQYNRFADEREQPFWDLFGLLQPVDSAHVADLGCGDGRLTAEMARALKAHSVIGVDSSKAMLSAANVHRSNSTSFVLGDIQDWSSVEPIDIVFSNAALHWIPDHQGTLARWTGALGPRGQLAVQVPANADHPVHELAGVVAREFLAEPPSDVVTMNVLAPDRYSSILYQLGFVRPVVRLEVYGHVLASTDDVVDWVKGSSLTRFKDPMGAEAYDRFIEALRTRVRTEIGDSKPYYYTFKRILMWGRLPE